MKIELTRAALHGETAYAEAKTRAEANHRGAYPGFRDAGELAALDAKYAAELTAMEEAGTTVTGQQRTFIPSEIYAAAPTKPPPIPEPQCHVLAIYLREEIKLTWETQDWDVAAQIAARETLTIEI